MVRRRSRKPKIAGSNPVRACRGSAVALAAPPRGRPRTPPRLRLLLFILFLLLLFAFGCGRSRSGGLACAPREPSAAGRLRIPGSGASTHQRLAAIPRGFPPRSPVDSHRAPRWGGRGSEPTGWHRCGPAGWQAARRGRGEEGSGGGRAPGPPRQPPATAGTGFSRGSQRCEGSTEKHLVAGGISLCLASGRLVSNAVNRS